ncbi:MAG: YraN family protein [Pseudomonadota bacterium]
MNVSHSILGKKAEDVACHFLLSHGLQLITRNYHCRYGEIDLIMQDNDTLVFVEVRYRKSEAFGGALESIDKTKQRKLVFTANHYLSQSADLQTSRFDVVALTENAPPEWIIDAFMEDDR